jgi:hypothetical protein
MSRCLIAYTGAGASGKQTHRAQACFNHTEDYGKNFYFILFLYLIQFLFLILSLKLIKKKNKNKKKFIF